RNETLGDAESVNEPRAGGRNVERGGVVGAEEGLHVARRAGHPPVGRDGREHDRVQLVRVYAGPAHGLVRGAHTEGSERLVGARYPPLADPGALDDPGVGGVEGAGEIVVGDDLVRHRSAEAGDLGKGAQRHEKVAAARRANWAPMCPSSWLSTACAATRIAFL